MTGRARRGGSGPLRLAVAATGTLGLVSLACAGLLAPGWASLAAAAFLAGCAASHALVGKQAARQRRAASVCVLLAVAGFAALHTGAGAGGDGAVASVGPVLAALLVGVQLAHALVLNTRRDLLVALAIGLFMTVLAAGLSPGVAVAVPLLAAWPTALAALALADRLAGVAGVQAVATAARVPAQKASSRAGVPVTVAVSVLIGLVVFLVLPQPAGLSSRSRLLGSQDSSGPPAGTTQTRSAAYYSSGYLDLRARGTLSNDPVVQVPADSPRLWRANVLDVYDSIGWQSSGQPQIQHGGPDFSIALAADDVVPPGTRLRTDTVRPRSGQVGGDLVSPGPVTAVHADTQLLLRVGARLVLPSTAGAQNPYTVTSVPQVTDPVQLRAATGPDLADPRWTELPASLPLRDRQLAATVTAGAPTRFDAVSAVERYLRANETYRLDSPVPAPGQDPVDDFLFNSHQGFCEQYASAEVVLLRARGIPARLVTGFSGGTVAPGGYRVMVASDAHAWVEVWYPGLGWSASDPTAGARLAAQTPPTVLAQVVQAVRSVAASPLGRVALAVALLVLVALVAVTVRGVHAAARRRRRPDHPTARRPAGPVLAAFVRLQDALAASGYPQPASQTIAECARGMPRHAWAAMAALEREVYGPAAPDPPAAQAAVDVLDALRHSLVAAPTGNAVPAGRR